MWVSTINILERDLYIWITLWGSPHSRWEKVFWDRHHLSIALTDSAWKLKNRDRTNCPISFFSPLVHHSQIYHLHFSQLWGTLWMSLRLPKFQEVILNQIKLLPLRRKPNHKNTHKPQYTDLHIHILWIS